jgi:hypothetical protein
MLRGPQRKGADALAAISGPSPDTPEAEPAVVTEERPELVVVTYRLRPEHVTWLARRALERKISRGARGRADASEVLRELLDDRIRDEP